MNGEQRFYLYVWLIVGIAVTIISTMAIGTYHWKVVRLANMGYQEVSYQGSQTSYYQKVK